MIEKKQSKLSIEEEKKINISTDKIKNLANGVTGSAFSFVSDFKEFISQGNVVDLAVGIIIGASFTTIVSSLVEDLISPFIGLALSGITLENMFIIIRKGQNTTAVINTVEDANKQGAVTVNYGRFVQSIISFFITAFCVFMLVRLVNKVRVSQEPEEEPPIETQECFFCFKSVPLRAIRCPKCTSYLRNIEEQKLPDNFYEFVSNHNLNYDLEV